SLLVTLIFTLATPPPISTLSLHDALPILLDLLIVLAKHKRIVLGVPFATAVVAAFSSLFLSNIYTGTTRILPPQQSASAGSALLDRKSTRLNSSHGSISYAVFCLKKKTYK